MTEKWMLQTLLSAGFTQHEAEVYIFLELNKPQDVANIGKTLSLNKRMVYRTLKKFKQMSIATASGNRRAYYSVVSFDVLLDLLINANIKQADTLQARKNEILSLLYSRLKDQV